MMCGRRTRTPGVMPSRRLPLTPLVLRESEGGTFVRQRTPRHPAPATETR